MGCGYILKIWRWCKNDKLERIVVDMLRIFYVNFKRGFLSCSLVFFMFFEDIRVRIRLRCLCKENLSVLKENKINIISF